MKIYISGAIHNQPVGEDGHRGSDVFRYAADKLKAMGHEPVVPQDIPAYHPYDLGDCPPAYSKTSTHTAACYMRGDLLVLLKCDAMLMVGDWENSVGAQREHSVACWTGIPVYYQMKAVPDARPWRSQHTAPLSDELINTIRATAEADGINPDTVAPAPPPSPQPTLREMVVQGSIRAAGVVGGGKVVIDSSMDGRGTITVYTKSGAKIFDSRTGFDPALRHLYELWRDAEAQEQKVQAHESEEKYEISAADAKAFGERAIQEYVREPGSRKAITSGMEKMLDAFVGWLAGERL